MRLSSSAAWLGLFLLLVTPGARALEPGQMAPDVSLSSGQGQWRLAEHRGKVVYLDFWASWCGPCKLSFPWMNQMQARYGAKGLRVVGINLDQKPQAAAAFLAQVPASFEVAYDPTGQTPRAYGVKAMPTSVLIGTDGKVLMVHGGFRDDQRDELEARIAAALAR